MSVNDAARIVTEGLIFICLDMLLIKHKEHMYRIVCFYNPKDSEPWLEVIFVADTREHKGGFLRSGINLIVGE